MSAAIRAASARVPHGTIAYREAGPTDGMPVVLVHGFPDDARTWDALAQALAADGRRAIAPFVRGYGATVLDPGVARSGEIAALARDVLALADALQLERFDVVGHDWGARAAYAAAVLAPERIRSLCTLAVPYGTGHSGDRLAFAQIRSYWYQWYFATPLGQVELEDHRAAFCRELWRVWSPGWEPAPGEYEATAASFENPDF
ncbi:MAG: alpha/beta fold hydrolase, partial [Candidatus Eremiobacteraeota bacterium]|nr:alpha/beta fold hydrolase [Candidatus Eremiobacteraeota bacterium]